ncbi:MAG: TetR/AcrR family transcriptional regulator [Acidimicrobiaceae bacterium]|nr:TetR/AcrR family transcriptional regulator [Acidimicrobiaceae bacterium]
MQLSDTHPVSLELSPGGGWINRPPAADQRVRTGDPERRLMEAMLLVSGERGYAEISVQTVISRAKASRNTFYRHFSDKEDCFTRAYEAGMDELLRQIIEPAHRADDWLAGVRAGATALVRVLEAEPAVARALLLEAFPAGRRTMDKRAEAMRRIAAELDRARSQLPAESEPMPALTSEIVVGGLESLVRLHLQESSPPRAIELLPDLVYFAINPYLGGETAGEQAAIARAEADRLARELGA